MPGFSEVRGPDGRVHLDAARCQRRSDEATEGKSRSRKIEIASGGTDIGGWHAHATVGAANGNAASSVGMSKGAVLHDDSVCSPTRWPARPEAAQVTWPWRGPTAVAKRTEVASGSAAQTPASGRWHPTCPRPIWVDMRMILRLRGHATQRIGIRGTSDAGAGVALGVPLE